MISLFSFVFYDHQKYVEEGRLDSNCCLGTSYPAVEEEFTGGR